jgi:hypothetical protein
VDCIVGSTVGWLKRPHSWWPCQRFLRSRHCLLADIKENNPSSMVITDEMCTNEMDIEAFYMFQEDSLLKLADLRGGEFVPFHDRPMSRTSLSKVFIYIYIYIYIAILLSIISYILLGVLLGI